MDYLGACVKVAIMLRDYMEGRTAKDGLERKHGLMNDSNTTGWGNYDN